MHRTTRKAGAFDRLVAAVLMVALAGYWIPATAYAGESRAGAAEIAGAVLLSDGLTPVPGVSVKAANVDTEQIYASVKTGQDGIYKLTGLPAGSYDLAVETSEGLYAADALVEAIPGKRVIVSLAIKGVAKEEPPAEGQKPTEGQQAGEQGKADKGKEEGKKDDKAEPEPKKESKKKKGFWRSPWGALVVIIPGAVLLGVAASSIAGDDDNEPNPVTPH
jgi:hypothetical protein